MLKLTKKTFLTIPLAFFLFLIISSSAHADSSLLINSKARTLTPTSYNRKSLPTPGSVVELTVNLLDGNKVSSLKTTEVFWYQDEKLFAKGTGLTNTKITLDDIGNSATIRVKVKKDSQTIEGITIINPISQTLYIESKKLISGSSIFLARPLFFNANSTDDLRFEWEANGEKVAGPDSLILNVPKEIESLELKSVVKNTLRPVEQISETITLKNG